MWLSSGMTLAGALASGSSAYNVPRPLAAPILLSDCMPGTRMFSEPIREVSREIDAALRSALMESTTLVTLL